MSDRIFFGSIERSQREQAAGTGNVHPAIAAGIAAGNINISSAGNREVMEFADSSLEAVEHQKALLQELEKKKLAKGIAVPTGDVEVRLLLRELEEPMCLFGEGPAERRDRLRDFLANKLLKEGKLPEKYLDKQGKVPQGSDIGGEAQKELVYTEGTKALKDVRMMIAKFSIPRAAERVAGQKRKSDEAVQTKLDEERDAKMEELADFDLHSSHIGDERPLTACAFSPNGEMLATGSWTSNCKIFNIPSGSLVKKLIGHTERVQTVQFHPTGDGPCVLASGGADTKVKLWSMDSENPIASLDGHIERVNRVAFHPSGRLLASTSHDHTWRLWDLETKTELLQQTGHSRPVYAFAFQGDGSLAVSTGLEGISRVWDLRTGRNIVDLKGHVKEVLAADFSPDGFTVATGSEDHTVRIFDLRKKKLMYTIPAHSGIVSAVKFDRGMGNCLVSSGYDNKAKIWDVRDWSLVKTLSAHEGKVMCTDITADGKHIATCGSDRTWKLWSRLGI